MNFEQLCIILDRTKPNVESGTVAEKRIWFKFLNNILKVAALRGEKDWERYIAALGERAGIDFFDRCEHCGSFFPKEIK